MPESNFNDTSQSQKLVNRAMIMVVEDSQPISNAICKYLQVAGYQTEAVFDGRQAANRLKDDIHYDLILLDVMLPYINGFELMEKILPKGIPVIFLTAKDQLPDKVNGLDFGAEDYITKPFEYEELLARVRVVLRRSNKSLDLVNVGDVTINLDSREVFKGGTKLDLTPKEFDLLALLIQNRKIALSRETLLKKVWGYDYEGDTRTVDTHVQRLRKKLGWNDEIRTIFKMGYRLE